MNVNVGGRGTLKGRITVDAAIEQNREALAALCRRYDVMRLELFGSAARGTDFDPTRSDFDFLVEFEQHSKLSPLKRLFEFADALEHLLGRRVDLVQPSAIRNPYVLADINRSRVPVYGS
jgi:predicted nucleotidyltransferase